eukprot:GHVH01004645.1.p1 GENE.GHVH01004645.1~~GHVH01004645.1.p1  ORF type:complete len:339 (+),score=37.11 GHVH01004645.1:510-1526(+)
MGLALPDGGHLSHGFATPKDPKFTAGAAFYQCKPYHVNAESGVVEYEELKRSVCEFKPRLLIAGASAYARKLEWKWFREAADLVGAYLLVDMAHISGLIAAEQHASPFPYADVVTTTTHKSLRGPRSAMVFVNHTRLGAEVAEQVHKGVFPGVQGGPHNHQIAALCTQLKEVMTDGFREYQSNVVNNCRYFAQLMTERGYVLVSGGTDTHLMVVNTKLSRGVTGSKVEYIAELCNVSLNKNTVPGDASPLSPSGIRIGTPAMTSRGCREGDMQTIVEVLDDIIELTAEIQRSLGANQSLKSFKEKVHAGGCSDQLAQIRQRVVGFSRNFRMPGSDLVI